MISVISKLKKLVGLVRAFLPSPVPQGMAEFAAWSASIIDLYGFPDNDSVKFALATMIIHGGPTAAYRSKFHFALMVKAGAAKQVASQVFQEIKLKQKQQAEATAASQVASDGPKQQGV